MSDEILGAWGELLALRSTLEDSGRSELLAQDPTLLRRDLAELTRIPGNREAFCRTSSLDAIGPSSPTGDRTLVDALACRLERDRSRLTTPSRSRWWQLQRLPSP
ncbi:MAG TPA: hypothetical protein RMH99_05995 [Sandaracinaceae bacterium LLY-WYZ-13_1]|nr:hypothetical protein [Sandaracinaceae bacterium LLY-WYZ-13_1]